MPIKAEFQVKSKWFFVVYKYPLQYLGYSKPKTFVAYLKFKSYWRFIWQHLDCSALVWRSACFVRRWAQALLVPVVGTQSPLDSILVLMSVRCDCSLVSYFITSLEKWMQKLTPLAAEILDNFRDLMCAPFHIIRTTGQSFWTGSRTSRVCIWRFSFPLFSLVTWSWGFISILKSQNILAFSSPEHPGPSFLNAWSLSLCQVVTRGGAVCMWRSLLRKHSLDLQWPFLLTLSVLAVEPLYSWTQFSIFVF